MNDSINRLKSLLLTKSPGEVASSIDKAMTLMFAVEATSVVILYLFMRAYWSILGADMFLLVMYLLELRSSINLLSSKIKQMTLHDECEGKNEEDNKDNCTEEASKGTEDIGTGTP